MALFGLLKFGTRGRAPGADAIPGAAIPRVPVASDEMLAEAITEGTVHACIALIARAIGDVHFRCRDKMVDEMLARPGKTWTRRDLQHQMASDMLLFGNAYVRRMGLQLLPLYPPYVIPEGDLVTPRYRWVGTAYARRQPEVMTPKQLIHLRYGAGVQQLKAIGPTAGGWARIEALRACDREIAAVFRHGIHMTHVLTGPRKEELPKVLAAISEAFGLRGDQRGGLVALPLGHKLESTSGMTPADGDLRDLRTDLIREVAALYGVPPFAAGGSSDTKYSNVVARHQQTNQHALLPLARAIADTLTLAFGAEVTFREEELIAGDFGTQIELALQAAGGPVLTPDEARKRFLGLGKVEGGNTLRGAATAEAEPAEDRRGELPDDGSESDR